ncbi:hypothetical protein BGX34_011019 [Mortierella sp. NVP85]|nr:hypothetical protein BGX34_011019 [Mortierella sp. NVP85]
MRDAIATFESQEQGSDASVAAMGSQGLCVPVSTSAPLAYLGIASSDVLLTENGSVLLSKERENKSEVPRQADVDKQIRMKVAQIKSEFAVREEKKRKEKEEEEDEEAIAEEMRKICEEISRTDDDQGLITMMQNKYLEMFKNMRRMERDQTKLQEKCELLQRDVDQLHQDRDLSQKSHEMLMVERNQFLKEHQSDQINLAKSNSLCRRLEGLCRHINNGYRRIKDEGQQSARHVHSEDQQPVNESSSVERLEDFREQYEIREKHFNSLMYSKDLELQLAHVLLQEERQNTQRETNKARLLEAQLLTSLNTERELREQLNTCETKLEKFEEAMGNSQLVFTTVQKATENLVKKTADLEGINQAIRARHDLLRRHIFELEEKHARDQQALEAANGKWTKLDTLCRTLHAERSVLRKSLKIHEFQDSKLSSPAPTISLTVQDQEPSDDKSRVEVPRTTTRSKARTMRKVCVLKEGDQVENE